MSTTAIRSHFSPEESKARCRKLRRRMLDLSQKVSALHVGGGFSCMETVEAIYFSLMRRRADGTSPDTFIMSKGHGCMTQYLALEELGILPTDVLEKYCKKEGILGAHPDFGNPGIEASTGSLGHGMAMAVGMAYADKIQNQDRSIYVVLSDGEFQEGSTWEALMIAGNLKVSRLVGFLDLNDRQSFVQTSVVNPNFYPVLEKVQAFGWQAIEVDGHNSAQIIEAVNSHDQNRPLLVICKTIKGKGVSFMENVPIWHYRSPNPEEYQLACRELESK